MLNSFGRNGEFCKSDEMKGNEDGGGGRNRNIYQSGGDSKVIGWDFNSFLE